MLVSVFVFGETFTQTDGFRVQVLDLGVCFVKKSGDILDGFLDSLYSLDILVGCVPPKLGRFNEFFK